MSTAGKVLVVLIMLASIGWMILTAGVGELNRNGNRLLLKLTDDVAKLQADLKETQFKIVELKDQTTVVQENIDNKLAVVRSQQSDVEEANSEIREVLSRIQYQLATVQETVKSAQQDSQERLGELEAEKKALADSKQQVETLMSETDEMMERLATLRKDFGSRFKSNVDLLGGQVR